MVAFELSVAHLLNLLMLINLSNEVLRVPLFVGRGQRCVCIPVCALVAASYPIPFPGGEPFQYPTLFKRILAIP